MTTPKKVHTSKVTENPDGSITVDVDGESYSFREPRGRDLSKLKRLVTPEMDEVEMLAILMTTLQSGELEPVKTKDEWLDSTPLYTFQKVGAAISDIFQL